MSILNEYVTNGKVVKDDLKSIRYSNLDAVGKMSQLYGDQITSRQHANLNDFDSSIHELLLKSNNIVEEYKSFAMGDLNKALSNKDDTIEQIGSRDNGSI